MAGKTITAQLDPIIKETKTRLLVLARLSVQEVIDIAQTPGGSVASTKKAIKKGLGGRGKRKRQGPVARQGKGGKMRVDTGFLRASGQLSFTGMPSGPVRGDPAKTYEYDGETTTLKLSSLILGQTVYFGWTAAYAAIRETYDGFLSSAVQQWPAIVAKITEQIKRGI